MNATWPSEYILLALLCERPTHGYQLHQLICTDEGLRAIWRIERSELYFLLRKLADQGYIVQTAGEQAGGPLRLIYAPTPTGRAALKKWLRTPERYPRDFRTGFLAKLYFTLRSQPQSALDLIDEQKRVLGEWAARQRERAVGDDFVAMVHKLRLSQTEAALAYLDELLTLIANSERTQANS